MARSPTIVVIFNPAAARGRARKVRAALEAALEAGVGPQSPGPARRWTLVETSGPGSVAFLARRAAEAGAGIVAAAGGDGTSGEVADGLVGTGAALGLLPLGTANDFARSVGVPRALDAAARALRDGRRARIDLCRVQWPSGARHALNTAGCGFDATVGARVNRGYRLLRGRAAYAAAVLASLRGFAPMRMQITVDDSTVTLEAMLCVVANGPTFGGGMRLAPAARPDDGLLDVCVVAEAGRWDLLRTLPRVYRGTHTTHPKVRLVQGRRVRLETAHPTPLLVDGDLVGLTPAELTVVPHAIDVILPA